MSQAPKLNIPTQDDTTPLLGRPSHPRGSSVSSEATLVEDEVTPLPLGQLTVLFLVRLAEPINFTVIFPFVNKVTFFVSCAGRGLMVVDDGGPESHR